MEVSESGIFQILDTVYQLSGYDFRGYSPKSIGRRVIRFCSLNKAETVDDVVCKLKNDTSFLEAFLREITVNVTEMFRDAGFFFALKDKIIPRLATYPIIRIWVAGCSSGEEAYSIALLLSDAGLLNKTIIYATDINTKNLEKAHIGIYKSESFIAFLRELNERTGNDPFGGDYSVSLDKVIISDKIKDHIVFTHHNLVSDQSFNEFHLVVCRNVLIYFSTELKERVLHLFAESLVNLGFLALGAKENLPPLNSRKLFKPFNHSESIWQKCPQPDDI